MKLYGELADWFPLLTAPEDYEEVAAQDPVRTRQRRRAQCLAPQTPLRDDFDRTVRPIEGLFSRSDWMRWLADAGLTPSCVPIEHSELAPGQYEVFVSTRGHH
jgi:hypothetical protein